MIKGKSGGAPGGAVVGPRVRVWLALGIGYIVVNLVTMYQSVRLSPEAAVDWHTWSTLPVRLASGTVYEASDTGMWFAWSPVMAVVMAAVSIVGYWPWVVAHIASVALLRDWRLVVLVLASWAFWFDTAQGNTFTFVFVAGVLALRRSRAAGVAFVGLCLLMPRPIQLPLLVWLLWHDRSLWKPAMVLAGLHAVAVLASGYAVAWLDAMMRTTSVPWDMGPVSALGPAWFTIGIPLAAWLTWRGRVGWAGLAISPYLIPQYLLWPLLEVRSQRSSDRCASGTAESCGQLSQRAPGVALLGSRSRRT
jgi:hypothetical protein